MIEELFEDINWALFLILSAGGIVMLLAGFKMAGAGAYPLWQKITISAVVVIASYYFSREK